MDKIVWEPVDVTPQSIPKENAYARISANSITFNAVAANLIENIEEYPWVVVHLGKIDNEPSLLAFHFTNEQTANAFPVKKQSSKHKGVTIFSRDLVRRYIGIYGFAIVKLTLEAIKLDDTTLAIKLLTEENLRKELGIDDLEKNMDALDNQLKNLFESP